MNKILRFQSKDKPTSKKLFHKFPVIVFDFDGTVADTWVFYEQLISEVTQKFGLKSISEEEIKLAKSMHTKEIIDYLSLPIWKIPQIVKWGREKMKNNMKKIKPVDGIKEVLIELKKKKYTLFIITSNSKENAETFLKLYDLNYFRDVYSMRSIFGKARVINKFLDEYSLKPNQVIYIGDEVRDIEACKKTGVPIISVSWGLNSKQFLQKYNSDKIITEPSQILQIIK